MKLEGFQSSQWISWENETMVFNNGELVWYHLILKHEKNSGFQVKTLKYVPENDNFETKTLKASSNKPFAFGEPSTVDVFAN